MDQPTSDHQASGTSLSDLRITRLLEALAPGADRTEDRESMRTLFESLGPRDAAEAHLAAIATASAQSALDYLARAAGPGVSDQTAIRLRSSALAAGRTYATLLHKLRKPAAEPLATAKPASVQAGEPAGTVRRGEPRRVPAAGPLRQAYPRLPHRSDDPRTSARSSRLPARPGPGGRGDRRGGGDDRRTGGGRIGAR